VQLTLDSSEKLDNVLRAVGGLYGVEIAVAGKAPVARRTSTVTAPARRPGRPARKAAKPARRPDAAAIREWAQANGHEISSRGRIPDAVVAAYDAG